MSNLFSSSIGKKLIMSVTGVCLVLFLLFHMAMNLTAVLPNNAYNTVCEFLGANWYALAATAILAAGFVIHILYATIITLKNMRSRGSQRYAVTDTPAEVRWASRNMFVLGLVVVGGLLIHLYNFWYNMQFVELTMSHEEIMAAGCDPTNGKGLIEALFAQPVYVAIYLVWLGALWFHLTHGFWSAFQTVGWNNKTWYPRLRCISNIVAALICGGFVFVVLFFFVKSLL